MSEWSENDEQSMITSVRITGVRELAEGVSALACDIKEIRFIPKDEMSNLMKSTKESVMLKTVCKNCKRSFQR